MSAKPVRASVRFKFLPSVPLIRKRYSRTESGDFRTVQSSPTILRAIEEGGKAIGDPKKLRRSLELKLQDQEELFDNEVKDEIYKVLHESKEPYPTKKLLEYELLGEVRKVVEDRLRRGYKISFLLNEGFLLFRKDVYAQVRSHNVLYWRIYSRIAVIKDVLCEIHKSNRYTKWTGFFDLALKEIDEWDPVKKNQEENFFRLISVLLQKYPTVREFFIKIVFKKEEQYEDLNVFVHSLLRNSEWIKMAVENMSFVGSFQEMKELICKQKFLWKDESRKKKSFLLPPLEINRTFHPDRLNLVDQISINGKLVSITQPGFDASKNRRIYYHHLVTALYSAIDHKIDKKIIKDEVDLYVDCLACDWNEIEKILKDDTSPFDKILLLREKLKSPLIDWPSLKDSLNKPIEEIKHEILYPKLPWLKILGLGTIETFGHATELIRNLFPQLTSIPFIIREVNGQKLLIDINKSGFYQVVQKRRFNVFERIQPDDPNCHIKRGKPHASIEFEWTLEKGAAGSGMLRVSNVEMRAGVTPETKSRILSALAHPAPLRKGWQSLPLPVYEPRFIIEENS